MIKFDLQYFSDGSYYKVYGLGLSTPIYLWEYMSYAGSTPSSEADYSYDTEIGTKSTDTVCVNTYASSCGPSYFKLSSSSTSIIAPTGATITAATYTTGGETSSMTIDDANTVHWYRSDSYQTDEIRLTVSVPTVQLHKFKVNGSYVNKINDSYAGTITMPDGTVNHLMKPKAPSTVTVTYSALGTGSNPSRGIVYNNTTYTNPTSGTLTANVGETIKCWISYSTVGFGNVTVNGTVVPWTQQETTDAYYNFIIPSGATSASIEVNTYSVDITYE